MAEVNVRIKAQNQTKTGFQEALRDAQGFSNSASGSMRTAFSGVASDIKSSIGGALAGLASFGAIRAIIDQFGRVQDLSEQFGVSAESIQRFGQLASEAGSSIDQVAAAFSRLTINIQKAQSGTGAQADALRELGLSATELANLSPEEAFLRLADALQKSGGSNSSYAAALDLIGGRQRDLIPLLAQGSDAIRAQAGAVSVASDEVVAKVDAMSDRFQRLGQQLAVGFGPVIANIGQGLLSIFATLQAAVEGIVGTIVQSVMGIGEVMKGNIGSGLGQIQSAPLENLVRVADELRAKLAEINAAPPVRPGRGMAGQLEAALEEQNNTRQAGEAGTRKGNVVGQQLGPGNIRGIEEAQREREAAARALGPELGPGTADAAAGGFRVDASVFARQQREETAKAQAEIADNFKQQRDALNEALSERNFDQLSTSDQRASVFGDANNLLQGLQDGQINPAEAAAQAVDLLRRSESLDQGPQNQFSGASSLQRVGLASNEFFTAPEEKTSKAVNEATRVITRIANLLENADPLVLER